MHSELSPLIVWTALWIVNTCSEFQVNLCSNNTDITKCQHFLQADDAAATDDDAKATAIPRVFSENSRDKNRHKSACTVR